MRNWERWVLILFFALVIAGVFLFCLKKYDLILGPDHYRYVQEGLSLARGELGQDFWLFSLFPDSPLGADPSGRPFGNAWIRGGKVYVIQPLGFPLLLAGAYLIGGKTAFFLTNPLIFLLLLLAQYFFVRELLFKYRGKDWVAFLSVLLLLWLPGYKLMFSSLHPSRDIPALMFFLWSMYFLLRSFRRKERITSGYLFLAVALAGYACLIRQTTIWLIFPGLVYLSLRLRKRKFLLLGFCGLFLLMLVPLVVENYQTFGCCFPQFTYLFEEGSPGGVHTMVSIKNFLPQVRRYSVWLYHVFPFPLLFLALLGVISLRRKKELWLLLIGWPLVNILFFSLIRYAFPRFIYPVFPAATALIAWGSWELVQYPSRWAKSSSFLSYGFAFMGFLVLVLEIIRLTGAFKVGYFDLVMLILGFGLLLSPLGIPERVKRWWLSPAVLVLPTTILVLIYFYVEISTSEKWEVPKRFKLARILEDHIPEEEALLLAERNLTYNLDFHTRFYSITPGKLQAFSGVSLEKAIQRIIDQNIPVYLLDNKGKKNARKHFYYLSKFFSLLPSKRLNAPDLGIHRKRVSERDVVILYRIKSGRDKNEK